jgi:hypothetical protein
LDLKPQFCTTGAQGIDALADERYRCLQLTSQEHSGTREESPRSIPQRETLFGRDRDGFLANCLDIGPESTTLVHHSRVVQRIS